MRYALIDEGKVVNVVEQGDPPSVSGFWLPCGSACPGWLYDAGSGEFSNPLQPVADPNAVPASVSMRQARLALLGAGKLGAVEAAIASLPSPQKEAAQIEWQYSNEVQRHNGFVAAMGPALGLSEVQLDALFVAAGKL